MTTENELVLKLTPRWPTLRRWIEVPGATTIFLSGDVNANLQFLCDMAALAVVRQGRTTSVEFRFLISPDASSVNSNPTHAETPPSP